MTPGTVERAWTRCRVFPYRIRGGFELHKAGSEAILFMCHGAPHPAARRTIDPSLHSEMRRLSTRLAIVLFLSVATLGSWGGRVLGLEAACRHEMAVSSGASAHADMGRADGPMAAMSPADGTDDRGTGDVSCCPSEGLDAPTMPCTDHHGAMPCTGTQLCAAASALRAPITLVAGLTVQARRAPAAAPAMRVAGPVFAPEVPPPRGVSPFRS